MEISFEQEDEEKVSEMKFSSLEDFVGRSKDTENIEEKSNESIEPPSVVQEVFTEEEKKKHLEETYSSQPQPYEYSNINLAKFPELTFIPFESSTEDVKLKEDIQGIKTWNVGIEVKRYLKANKGN